jgi:hypothetical protein
MGWLVWGMCYYVLITGDRSHIGMIKSAGDWLLYRQITDEEDPRYGLLTGGYGAYNMADYSYDPVEIEWCSTEHQCSALQALHGLALVTSDKKYAEAADLLKAHMIPTLYDTANGRFYQGCSKDGVDGAWALDCSTWAGRTALSVLNSITVPAACGQTAYEEFLVTGAEILQSSEQDHYNLAYSLDVPIDGFKPYTNRGGGYDGAPEIVWSEGTLGYAALMLALGDTVRARRFVDAMIDLQNCNGSTGGVLYTTATYASLPWEFHVWESVVSSAWLYLIINAPDTLFPIIAKRESFLHKMTRYPPKPKKR